MANRNYASIMGNLTADPELHHTDNGKAVANMTVAVNYGSGETKRTEFIPVRVWDKWAEYLCKTAKKGSLVNVDGYLTLDKWVDQKSNENRSRLLITARSIFHVELQFAEEKKKTQANGQQASPAPELQPAGVDDPPF